MSHRKEKHVSSIPMCKSFVKGQCKFRNDYCWFRHDNTKSMDFQIAPKNPDPPYTVSHKISQDIEGGEGENAGQ